MKSPLIATVAFAAMAMSQVAGAQAYEFATRDACQMVSCGTTPRTYVEPNLPGYTAYDIAVGDSTLVKVNSRPVSGQAEFAAFDRSSGSDIPWVLIPLD